MTYDWNNRELLNDVYVHDVVFSGFHYDYPSREITMAGSNYHYKFTCYFHFQHVIWCSMQSCHFWSCNTDRIEWMDVLEDCPELDQLYAMQDDSLWSMDLRSDIHFLPVKFTLSTGDTLTVICERVSIETLQS